MIAGDLVDPEVNIEVFEVVFLQPAVEHRPDDLCGGACRVVTQNAHFDLIALGVGGTDDEAADGRKAQPHVMLDERSQRGDPPSA